MFILSIFKSFHDPSVGEELKLLHVVTGFDFPFFETFELRLTLHDLDRMH